MSISDDSSPFFDELEDHDPVRETPSRVYVNGTRIPVGDVDVHMRKEGPLDVTRYIEGEFASPYDGVTYTDAFDGLSPSEQSSPDTVRVDVRDRVSGNYYTSFRGLVTGVGNSSEGGERWWNFRAQGPGHRLSDIPASKPFDGASVDQVLGYVAGQLDSHTPFNVSLGTTEDVQVQSTNPGPDGGDGDDSDNPAAGFPGEYEGSGGRDEGDFPSAVNTQKTFHFGKHTLSDVVSWVGQKTNLYIWLVPASDGVALTAQRNPPTNTHTAHYLDGGETRVVNNDALTELKPVNTLIVKSPAKDSVSEDETYERNERGERLVAVKARHTQLYERAGGREYYAEPERLSDAMTKTEVENEARKRLKQHIDSTTEGDMQTLLRSPVTPYDIVAAKPTCDEQPTADFPPLTYEVSRVHHEVTASDIPETKLNVGLHTDSMQDIEIIDSWQPEGPNP